MEQETVGSYNKIEKAVNKEELLKLYAKIELIEKNLKRTEQLHKEKSKEIENMMKGKINMYELNILEEREEMLKGSINSMCKTLSGLYVQFNELYYVENWKKE